MSNSEADGTGLFQPFCSEVQVTTTVNTNQNVPDTAGDPVDIDDPYFLNVGNMDIVPDDVNNDPDYIPANGELGNTETHIIGKVKRTRNKHLKPHEWQDKQNFLLQEIGMKYVGWERKGEKAKRGKKKAEKVMGPASTSQACVKASTGHCQDITEDQRQTMFNTFWNTLSWDQKKMYVASLMKKVEKKEDKKKGEVSRRSTALKYSIKTVNVCKNMFLSTFGLGEWSVANWASGHENTSME